MFPGSSKSVTINLSPPAAGVNLLTSVSCDQTAVVSGTATGCSVQLAGAAPVGRTTVQLSAAQPGLLLPGSVHVAEGAQSARFTLNTRPSDRDTAGVITAATTANTQQASLAISALKPSSLSCSPNAQTVMCEVQLSARIADPVSLTVSGSRNVKVPPAITTRPQQSSLTFEAVPVSPGMAEQISVRVGFGAHSIDTKTLAVAAAFQPPPPSQPMKGGVDSGAPVARALVNAAASFRRRAVPDRSPCCWAGLSTTPV